MSFKIDGVEPTSITLDGVDLTDVTMDGVGVWGKPFTLSISTDANVTVTVTRTSSPYQNASLGQLSTGSLIYYGDAITILAQRKSGYYISSLLVNDKQYIDNSTTTEIETYWTVSQPITISATSIAAAGWHTVFSGTSTVSFNLKTLTTKDFSTKLTVPNNTTKIRVDFAISGSASKTYTNYELTLSNGNVTSSNLSPNTSNCPELYLLCSSYVLKAQARTKNTLLMVNVSVTKLQAYY